MKVTNEEIKAIDYSRTFNLACIRIQFEGSNEFKTAVMGSKGSLFLNLGFFEGFQKMELDKETYNRIIRLIEMTETVGVENFKKLNWFVNIEEA